jgi:hypothetical protein
MTRSSLYSPPEIQSPRGPSKKIRAPGSCAAEPDSRGPRGARFWIGLEDRGVSGCSLFPIREHKRYAIVPMRNEDGRVRL